MSEQSLRACPFCKSPNVYVWECEDASAGCSTFWVECECGARGSISEYKEGAAQYWNGVSPHAVITERCLNEKCPRGGAEVDIIVDGQSDDKS